MRVCLLHIGAHVATIHAEGHTFSVFVNELYHRAFFELEDAREYAIKILSEFSDDE